MPDPTISQPTILRAIDGVISAEAAEAMRVRASGPEPCLHGELAHHVDSRLTDIILADIMLSELTQLERNRGLRLLRLLYWEAFHEHAGLWLSPCERDLFRTASTNTEIEVELPERARFEAWAAGAGDGGAVRR